MFYRQDPKKYQKEKLQCVLNSQNFETNEKLIKFATLQEQLDSQYEGHENYGDKLVKVSG